MDLNEIGGVAISRTKPQITVRITNNPDDISSGVLRLQRVGEKSEFAEYSPTRIGTDFLEFTFDELLFSKAFGRYRARLLVDKVERMIFYLQYKNDVIMQVVNHA